MCGAVCSLQFAAPAVWLASRGSYATPVASRCTAVDSGLIAAMPTAVHSSCRLSWAACHTAPAGDDRASEACARPGGAQQPGGGAEAAPVQRGVFSDRARCNRGAPEGVRCAQAVPVSCRVCRVEPGRPAAIPCATACCVRCLVRGPRLLASCLPLPSPASPAPAACPSLLCWAGFRAAGFCSPPRRRSGRCTRTSAS